MSTRDPVATADVSVSSLDDAGSGRGGPVWPVGLLVSAAVVVGGVTGLLQPAAFWLLAIDCALCVFLSALFQSRFRVLFWLHPVIIIVSSTLFTKSFLTIGDGAAYESVVRSYLDTSTANLHFGFLIQAFGVLGFFKHASLGVAPIFLIPEYFFDDPGHEIYYLWQNVFHVGLISFVVGLARVWNAVDERYLLPMALFAAVSPAFFELASTPTRHMVTFFGVFLFFVAYKALDRAITPGRLLGLGVAVLAILISKAPLLLPALVFVLADRLLVTRARFDWRALALVVASLAAFVVLGDFFVETTLSYLDKTAKEGAATFSWLTQIPLIGVPVKYVYAILSPFPWWKAANAVNRGAEYGGNWLVFAMHVASGLMGCYIFFLISIRGRRLLRSNLELKRSLIFGLIMSSSIIGGATGFTTYLLIFYPFLAPVLAYRDLQISPLLPIVFVAMLELFMLLYGT